MGEGSTCSWQDARPTARLTPICLSRQGELRFGGLRRFLAREADFIAFVMLRPAIDLVGTVRAVPLPRAGVPPGRTGLLTSRHVAIPMPNALELRLLDRGVVLRCDLADVRHVLAAVPGEVRPVRHLDQLAVDRHVRHYS